MISLRNCCYAAIRYEIMEVVPALFWGRGPVAHLTSKRVMAPDGPVE